MVRWENASQLSKRKFPTTANVQMESTPCSNVPIQVSDDRWSIFFTGKDDATFASIDPCSPNPCGAGECEITANILNGYICRCLDGTIEMTNCSKPKSNDFERERGLTRFTAAFADPCAGLPCGSQGRCLALTAAPKGYMCMCQSEGITFTTIDTCPSKGSCLSECSSESIASLTFH